MEWVKLASTYYDDPAVAQLTDAAEIMFLRSLAYCGRAETGGFVPTPVLPQLCRRNGKRAGQAVQELLDAGLWQPSPTGWQVTKWDAWQRELEDIKHLRELARERMRRHRAKAAGKGEEWKT